MKITTRYGTGSAATTTISSLTPGSDIKEIRHKRTFDPMCISLPSNTVTVTLYNYSSQYDGWYKTYADYTTHITLQYGFELSSRETIAGGEFTVSNIVMNNDNTITVTAGSGLDTADDADTISDDTNMDKVVDIYRNSNSFGSVTELSYDSFSEHNFVPFSASELMTTAASAYGISINVSSAFANKAVELAPGWEYDSAKALMYTLNYIQGNAKIARTETGGKNVLDLQSGGTLYYSGGIQSLNIMERPEYELTSKVRYVKISGGGFLEAAEATHVSQTATGSSDMSVEFDYTKNELLSVRTNGKNIVYIQRGKKYGIKGYHFQITHSFSPEGPTVYLTYKERSAKALITTADTGNGSICDVKNEIERPPDADRFKNYFNNRDLYTVEMRADPARDVGDYVFAELEPGVFSKVIILESELTFEGAFSEKTLVRKITSDFETVTVNNMTPVSYFTVSDDGKATKYTGTAANVTVPPDITNLDGMLFRENSMLSSCTMHPLITHIGDMCFYGCTNLKNIIIPDSVKSMGLAAFGKCTALTDAILSRYISEIPSRTFYECSALRSVMLPDTAEVLDFEMFMGCSALKSIKLPGYLTSIGKSCFESSGLTEIFIPSGVGYIRDRCFADCKNLTKVSLSPYKTSIRIGAEAFLGCSKLKDISLENAGTIEKDAFKNCSSLTRVVMPQVSKLVIDVTEFGDNKYTEGGFSGVLVIKRGSKNLEYLVDYAESYGFQYEIID
ncbi:MAG: leucine-rich repeat domain-containing protein [bacterium]|nr:leucine-rich repeat domain-containing protein [bacterium]